MASAIKPNSSARLVIGLDSSTQSTKAVAWTNTGVSIAEGNAPIPLSNPEPGRFEQDAQAWWRACCATLQDCLSKVEAKRVDGIAISNQRETVAFMDEYDNSVYPAIVWLDERARDTVETFSKRFGADRIHQISGRPADITPCLYRFEWMRQNEPEIYAKTAYFVDVQAYLVKHLVGGIYRTGWTSAEPMGIFDVEKKGWSPDLLQALNLDESRLPQVVPPGTELGRISTKAAEATGLLVGTPVFAAGGDGQCAGLGANCTRSDRAYINLGTAVVSGVWAADYKCNLAWRTQIAAHGEGYIYENCLRSGAFLINWFINEFMADKRDDADLFTYLEAEAAKLPIGSHGLLVQPYWSGVMDPYWDSSARGLMLGLGNSHTRIHIYRAIIEGITLNQVICTQALEEAAGQEITHYFAVGGGAHSRLWRQILADASGKDVLIGSTVEVSSLGAAMIAGCGAGWYSSIVDAAQAMSSQVTIIRPNTERTKRYHKLLDIYRGIYHATQNLNQKLVQFAAEGMQ